MPRGLTVLGLDPGYGRFGFGLIRAVGSSFEVLTYGVIETDKKAAHSARLLAIFNGCKDLIKKYQPDLVSIEKIYFAQSTTTALKVAEARGAALAAMAVNGLPITELLPLEIKQIITGQGRADKRQIEEMLRRELGIKQKITPDDAADGLAVALSAILLVKSRSKKLILS